MKNINKSNIEELVGKEIVNVKNNVIGVVANIANGKYTVIVNEEEKIYSESTIIKNWKIVEDETEKMDEVVLTTEETSNEENITEEIEDENKTVEETEEEVINENDEIVEEETEEFILETENEGIIDNIKETEGKVKITV